VQRFPRSTSQGIGGAWLDGGAHLALVVPSVLVPQEKNYVLNVAHAQFAGVRVANSEPFSFDERLWSARR
jgi:RES domain-containing protein